MRERRELLLSVALLIAAAVATAYHMPALAGEAITPETELPIDGTGYLQCAARMIMDGRWILSHSVAISPGMQILSSLLLRVSGPPNTTPIVIWNLVMMLGIALLVGASILRACNNRVFASLGVLLISLSTDLWYYSALYQYEITVAFLCLAVCTLSLGAATFKRGLLIGFLIALLAIFRMHFAALLPFCLGFTFLRRRTTGAKFPAGLILGFLLLALPFNAYYAREKNLGFFFFQTIKTGNDVWDETSAISTGAAMPYTLPDQVTGPEFIRNSPGLFFELLARRVSYFVGWEPQVWFFDSFWVAQGSSLLALPIELVRKVFVIMSLVLMLLGLQAIYAGKFRGGAEYLVFLFPVCTVAGHLILVNSTSRYMVPAIPCIIFLVVLGMESLAARTGLVREQARDTDQ